jgi:CheY-like chemotaxis protein
MIKKVLIVDDDKKMLRALKKGLEKYSGTFSFLTAEDGLIAVELLKKNNISLVVTDLKMPRMDGLTLLSHIKEHYPDIPVIIITGDSTPKSKKLAQERGVIEYIKKPFKVEDLAREIISTLKKEADGGILRHVSSGMFLQLLEMEQKTCTIRLTDERSGKHGVLFFREGELLDARVNGLQGEAAAYKIFAWDEVTLSIENTCSLKEGKIQGDLQAILLEAMRLKDEVGQEEEPAAVVEGVEPDEPSITIRRKTEKEVGEKPARDKYQDISIGTSPVSYAMANRLKSFLGSTAITKTLKILGLFLIVSLMAFLYLFITMETEKDLLKKIAHTKAQIQSSQETLDLKNEMVQEVWEEKIESVKHNESQVKIMGIQLKIYELEEEQEKIQAHINIQQKALDEDLKKLEEMKRRSFSERLFRQ